MRDRLGLDHYWLKVDMGAQENERIFETLRVIAAKILPEVRWQRVAQHYAGTMRQRIYAGLIAC